MCTVHFWKKASVSQMNDSMLTNLTPETFASLLSLTASTLTLLNSEDASFPNATYYRNKNCRVYSHV